MKTTPTGSRSFQKRNPHLFEVTPQFASQFVADPTYRPKPPKRLRQSSKPLLNKLEQEWLTCLEGNGPYSPVYAQSVTFRIANGLRFTVDFFSFDWPAIGEASGPTAWEVKGPWFTDDANAKLKMFAHTYPEIRVILAYKHDGQWVTERVRP